MFYFMLSNISPNKRSKLRGIQLLAICKQKMIKRYGINQILKPIIDDIKAMVDTYDNLYSIVCTELNISRKMGMILILMMGNRNCLVFWPL